MYHVPWIAFFSANRWRLDVLTFHIKGFAQNNFFQMTLALPDTLAFGAVGRLGTPKE